MNDKRREKYMSHRVDMAHKPSFRFKFSGYSLFFVMISKVNDLICKIYLYHNHLWALYLEDVDYHGSLQLPIVCIS